MNIQKATHKCKVKCICGAYLWFRDMDDGMVQPITTVIREKEYPYINNRPNATGELKLLVYVIGFVSLFVLFLSVINKLFPWIK